MSTTQDERRSGEDRRSGKDRLTGGQSMGEDIDKSCQICLYAYLTKDDPDVKTKHEACSMGMLPIQLRLPEDWACNLFQKRALD